MTDQTSKILEGVTFEAVNVPGRPAPWDEGRAEGRPSWDCTFTYRGASLTVPFWQGVAAPEPPTMLDVLDCIVADLYYDDPTELDDLLDGMAYSDARRVVESLERHSAEMRRVFGDELDALADEVREAVES